MTLEDIVNNNKNKNKNNKNNSNNINKLLNLILPGVMYDNIDYLNENDFKNIIKEIPDLNEEINSKYKIRFNFENEKFETPNIPISINYFFKEVENIVSNTNIREKEKIGQYYSMFNTMQWFFEEVNLYRPSKSKKYKKRIVDIFNKKLKKIKKKSKTYTLEKWILKSYINILKDNPYISTVVKGSTFVNSNEVKNIDYHTRFHFIIQMFENKYLLSKYNKNFNSLILRNYIKTIVKNYIDYEIKNDIKVEEGNKNDVMFLKGTYDVGIILKKLDKENMITETEAIKDILRNIEEEKVNMSIPKINYIISSKEGNDFWITEKFIIGEEINKIIDLVDSDKIKYLNQIIQITLEIAHNLEQVTYNKNRNYDYEQVASYYRLLRDTVIPKINKSYNLNFDDNFKNKINEEFNFLSTHLENINTYTKDAYYKNILITTDPNLSKYRYTHKIIKHTNPIYFIDFERFSKNNYFLSISQIKTLIDWGDYKEELNQIIYNKYSEFIESKRKREDNFDLYKMPEIEFRTNLYIASVYRNLSNIRSFTNFIEKGHYIEESIENIYKSNDQLIDDIIGLEKVGIELKYLKEYIIQINSKLNNKWGVLNES